MFVGFGFLVNSPKDIFWGLIDIIKGPDLLITDYIAVGGIGAAFVNAGLLTLATIFILYKLKINISGVSVATVFLMTGFALFGKNIFNVWLIILGVVLYSKVQKDKFSKYVYIALFGTSLAPTITEIIFSLEGPLWVRIFMSIVIGLGIGFFLPPLSGHLLKVHQGFNLYNVGFSAGIMGTIFVSVFRSYGFTPRSNMVWSTGNNMVLVTFLCVLFSSMLITGFYLNHRSLKGLDRIFASSGRLVTDFILLEGFGISLFNMGLNGLVATSYVLLVGGDLNGPTVGGILTVVGFGAFGKHIKNILPIFLGIVLGSLTTSWSVNDPSILLAALFGTSLAPIAGKFGCIYGMTASFINASVVLNVGILHGGLNLYNTGFSSGIVAAILIPIIEAFRKEEVA